MDRREESRERARRISEETMRRAREETTAAIRGGGRFDVETQAALLGKILNPVHDGMNSAYVALEGNGSHRVTIDASYDLTPEEAALIAAIHRRDDG